MEVCWQWSANLLALSGKPLFIIVSFQYILLHTVCKYAKAEGEGEAQKILSTHMNDT